MTDRRVSITLTFATDTPPPAVAMAVGHTVTAHIPDRLDSINWTGFDLDEESDDE